MEEQIIAEELVEGELDQRYDPETMHKTFAQISKTLLLFIGIQFLLSILMAFVMIPMLWNIDMIIRLENILQAVLSLVSSWIIIRRGKKKFSITNEDLRKKNPWSFHIIVRYALIGMGLSVIGSLVVMLINQLIGGFGLQFVSPDLTFGNDVIANLFFLLSVIAIAPIFEECIFRGIVTQTLARYDKRFAIIISAVLFSMMHLNLVQGIPTFLLGLVLGYVFVQSGSLIPCILIHFINNAMSICESGLTSRFAWAEVIVVIYTIAMVIYAIVMIARHHKEMLASIPTCAKQYHLYRTFFNTGSFIIFAVIFCFFVFVTYMVI